MVEGYLQPPASRRDHRDPLVTITAAAERSNSQVIEQFPPFVVGALIKCSPWLSFCLGSPIDIYITPLSKIGSGMDEQIPG